MKLVKQDLHIIRSMANDNLRDTPKHSDLDPFEVTSLAWAKAVIQRLNLPVEIEMPTKFNPRPDKGYKP